MPDFNHPPYNTIQPRILNRWLDVNSQNGPLGRVQSFITIPSFNINSEWDGYSKIVASFDYNSPNNFSLKNLVDNDNGSCVLCISYVNADHTVNRHRLNETVGNIFSYIPQYGGQKVKKNFRIEVWSVSASNCTNNSDIVLMTSVRGNVDYRFGNDSSLCLPVLKDNLGVVLTGDYELVIADGPYMTASTQFNTPYPPDAVVGKFVASIGNNDGPYPAFPLDLYLYTKSESQFIYNRHTDEVITSKFFLGDQQGEFYFVTSDGSVVGQWPQAKIERFPSTAFPVIFPNSATINQ